MKFYEKEELKEKQVEKEVKVTKRKKSKIENYDDINSKIDEILKEIDRNSNNLKIKPEKNKKSDDEIKKEIIEKNNRRHKRIILSISIPISILIVLLILSTGFALVNINNTKIISGISVNGIDLKGYTKQEAIDLVNNKMLENMHKNIILKSNDFDYTLNPSQIEVQYDIESAVENAFKIGRNGNIFENNYNIVKSLLLGNRIISEISYNEEALTKLIEDISVKIPEALIQTSYYTEENKLIITKGKSGNIIEKEKVKEIIISKIKNNNFDIENINIIHADPEEINLEEIYNNIYTEPKDASYTTNPFQIFPHIDGVKFDMELAKEALKEEKDEYEIPLIITTPKITTNQIGTEAFPNLLSSFSTKYDASLTGRSKNLMLAAEKINGTVVMPGEIFSYNKTVGERTIAKGYTEAAGYAGGKVVQTLGGGICQISSTLYDAVVYANLEVVKRTNHMFLTSYTGAGQDATVVYGSIDFQFKNTRQYPIKIQASVKNGIAKIEIYGVKEETEYEVEISTKILEYLPFSVIYENDNRLSAGTQVVEQGGMNGVRSITYKILKLNGVQVSSSVLSTDTYSPMNKIIRRGPEAVKTNPTPEPVIEPEQEITIIQEPEIIEEPKIVETPEEPKTPEE